MTDHIISEKAASGGLAYGFVPLTKEDVKKIYIMAFSIIKMLGS